MTKDEMLLPVELLKKLISLDAATGKMTWLKRGKEYFFDAGNKTAESYCRCWNKRLLGKPAVNSPHGMGYLHGCIFGRKYLAHRVVWAIHTGEWPVNHIDHINGLKKDNRPSNLRDVPHKENCKNQKLRVNNKSGHIGIAFDKARNKFEVTVSVDFKTKHLGRFETFEEALSIRNASYEANGFHQNHGRVSA